MPPFDKITENIYIKSAQEGSVGKSINQIFTYLKVDPHIIFFSKWILHTKKGG